MAKPTEARVHAKNIAELNDELFAAIYSNLQLYEEVVVQSVDEKDQVFASNVQRSIYKIIKKSQETAQELHNAGEEKSRALQCKFGEYARYLNNFQLSMTKSVAFSFTENFSSLTPCSRLLLQNFQRLGRDGDIAFLNTPTAPSESLSVTLRSDIEPIRVRYEDDLQLKRAFDRKDTTTTTTTTTMLESLFDSQDNNTVSHRSTGDPHTVCSLNHLSIIQASPTRASICINSNADIS